MILLNFWIIKIFIFDLMFFELDLCGVVGACIRNILSRNET